jgi:membrane fusion protein, heavy metal efflux system
MVCCVMRVRPHPRLFIYNTKFNTMKNLKYILLIIIFCNVLQSMKMQAHEGHDHGAEEETTVESSLMSSSEAHNEQVEILLKFFPSTPGDSLEMKLYVSDYRSNLPVQVEHLTLGFNAYPERMVQVIPFEKGVHLIKTIMPDELVNSLVLKFHFNDTDHRFELHNVDFTHRLREVTGAHEHSHWWMYLCGAGILILGVVLGRITRTIRHPRTLGLVLVALAFPLTNTQQLRAHEGPFEELNLLKSPGENQFILAKESQFLMEIRTDFAGSNAYQDGRKLYGTVIPSVGGQSHVALPQYARITQINILPGQAIRKGTTIAIAERISDPLNNMLMSAERNRLFEEMNRLQKEVERLQKVGDLIAKRELETAESEYAIAKSNYELYNTQGATFSLVSPIDGVVSPFTWQIGDVVDGGLELFTITNIGRVYIECQAFEKDVEAIKKAQKYLAQCADGNHSSEAVRLLSLGCEFNSANQSQKVFFEIDNPNQEFKIGEFVNIWTYAQPTSEVVAVLNSAITELQGRPVMFVKNKAEEFELRYVRLGHNNGQWTVILSGLKSGDRFVTMGAYQCKLVYLNQ